MKSLPRLRQATPVLPLPIQPSSTTSPSFVDIDTIIEEKIDMKISTFFEKYGEDAFQSITPKCIRAS